MVTQQERAAATVEFAGTKAQRQLAEQVLGLLRARGRFMADETPIRVSFDSLVEYLATTEGGEASGSLAKIEAMVAANPAVFIVEQQGEARLLVTTRAGHAPTARQTGSIHDFARRFMTPLPKPEQPPMPVRERPRVDPSWASLPAVIGGLDFEEEADLLEQAAAEAPTAVTTEPAAPISAAAPAVPTAPTTPVLVERPAAAAPPAPLTAPPPAEPSRPEVAAVAAPEAATEAPTPTVVPASPQPEPEAAAAPAAPVAAEAPVPPVVAAPPVPTTRTITLPITAPTDVSGVDDEELAAAIRQRLQADPRVANFGEQWLMEDRVPRFSRGDLRRLKEYLQEQEQPLTDDVLAQDVLGVRPGTNEFELVRFAINFRLLREHREFEFVGTSNQRFWSTTGLPQIGTTRRKPNEIGTDYRFLLDEVPAETAPRSLATVDHTLTFYEYLHGLLPFDAAMQALLPAPVVPNQRAVVLTFECPQVYTTYLVEVRYPTPNRGGFILGLDDFYTENLVPGAILAIAATENDGHYRVEYLAESGQSARLLELDERRAQRYVFRPTSFACGVDEEMLLTEERFGGLNGDKPLDEKVRRRPEAVVAATFERIGANRDGNYSAPFATLLSGVNLERPISAPLLRSILEHDDTGAFSLDPEGNDVYTYVPGATP